jgi:hypothetical protein
MEQNISSAADSSSGDQNFPCLLWNLHVQYNVQKNQPLQPVMIKTNLIHIIVLAKGLFK